MSIRDAHANGHGFLDVGLSPLIATVFVLAILSLAAGLLIFLVEVRVATAALRIGR